MSYPYILVCMNKLVITVKKCNVIYTKIAKFIVQRDVLYCEVGQIVAPIGPLVVMDIFA